MARANHYHRTLTHADKKLICALKEERKRLREELSYLSDRALAKKFECSHRTIGRV